MTEEIQNEVVAPTDTVETVETTEEKSTEGTEALAKAEAKIVELKKELKGKKAPKETTKEVKSDPDKEFGLLELTYLKGEEVKGDDEVKFVQEQLTEAGLTKDQLPKLFSNKYFQSELKGFRDAKAVTEATSEVKGGGGGTKASDSPEHWIAKGVPPTKEQVPDRAKRVEIARAMMKNASGSGKKFYNE